MIKAVILDVDGVIVGKKEGFNFPLPHQEIIGEFRRVRQSGLPLILCTAKYFPAIAEIVKKSNLDNPHITDGGALVLDILNDRIIAKHLIKKDQTLKIAQICRRNKIYAEFYTTEDYYIEKDSIGELSYKRAKLLQKEYLAVNDLSIAIKDKDLIKIIVFTKNESDKEEFTKIFEVFGKELNLLWSHHPYLMPALPYVFTSKKATKKLAAQELIMNLKISFDEVLGIGDGLGDWEFMQLCRFVGTLDNATDDLKKLIKLRGGYIAKGGVDDHGILDIFKNFSII